MLPMALLYPDGTPIMYPRLGMGRTGVVVKREGKAWKLPIKRYTVGLDQDQSESLDYCADLALKSLEHEKNVYRRLGKHDGIVECLDLSGVGIQMAWMVHGSLQDYLEKNHPSKSDLIKWFQDMARTLAYIHDQCVIVADIATRNFLVDIHRAVKFSDFSESSILPHSTDMESTEDDGYSIYTDIGELGAVMYEVITRKRCKFDLFENQQPGFYVTTWPRRESLPTTENIWLGSVIEACWTKGALQNAHDLLAMLESTSRRELVNPNSPQASSSLETKSSR